MVHISIVIPTRQRADTLRRCLETCVAQDFREVEFIVSSNACTDDTKNVTLGFNDSRVRLVETPIRLSMSENWEFALGHTRGQYVGYLGDDDGILPMGLSFAWSALTEYNYPAVAKGPPSVFVWPNAVSSMSQRGWNPGTLTGSMGDEIRILNSREMLTHYANSEAGYWNLPGLYYGLVKSSVIQKAKRGGRFFHSKIPDVYAAVAIAAVSDSYLLLHEAIMMSGLSSHSSGAVQLYGQDAEKRGSDGAELFSKENNLPFHPALTECPSIPVLAGESFLQAADLGLFQPPLDWNFQRMLDAAIAELPTKPDAIQREIIQALKDIASHHNLDSSKIPSSPTASLPVPRSSEVSVTSHGATFHIETRAFKIESISEATRFYGLLQCVTKCLIATHAGAEARAGDAEARTEEARAHAHAAETQAAEARSLKAIAEAARATAETARAAAEAARAAAEKELAGLRASRSWRVTAPFRVIDALARGRPRAALTESGLSDDHVRWLRQAWAGLKSFRRKSS